MFGFISQVFELGQLKRSHPTTHFHVDKTVVDFVTQAVHVTT